MVSSPPPNPQVILDTDPGGDDIFALLWLLSLVKQGLVDLTAVTTTAGNVAAAQTFTNASQVLSLVGYSHIPLGRGHLIAKMDEDASHIHGADGMGNLSVRLPTATHKFTSAPASADLLIRQLSANPQAITVIAIGPLTNLAAAETQQPGILQQAKEIILMGGAFTCPGNITPQAEFNIWYDPAAAQTVFESRTDLVVLPLDLTRQLIFTQEMAQTIAQTNPSHPLAAFLLSLCEFMVSTTASYRETGRTAGFLVHDAATLGYLCYPHTLRWQRAQVNVETQGQWTRGQTLIDRRTMAKFPANSWVATEVHQAEFFAALIEDLKLLLSMI